MPLPLSGHRSAHVLKYASPPGRRAACARAIWSTRLATSAMTLSTEMEITTSAPPAEATCSCTARLCASVRRNGSAVMTLDPGTRASSHLGPPSKAPPPKLSTRSPAFTIR
eukprot:scaffold28804_cov114-Isochrysis_galbana.AAC.2